LKKKKTKQSQRPERPHKVDCGKMLVKEGQELDEKTQPI
jgi:hypothetical protein